MNQSTENLIHVSYDQLYGKGYANDAATIYQSVGRPPSSTFEFTSDDAQMMTNVVPAIDAVPSFVLGPYNHRKRLLSCIVENWPESDSFNSLPADINPSPRDTTDCAGVPMKKPFSWEAEDVADYITTLDEACILDIESYEEVDKIPDQQHWIAQTCGPIYEPLLKPREDLYARPKSLCISYEAYSTRNGDNHDIGDTILGISNQQSAAEYSTIVNTAASCEILNQITDLDDNPKDSRLLQARSTDNLLLNGHREDDFLYLNPAYNRSKCRTPLPVLSLNSSFYDESTSMNSSMHDPNTMTGSQMSGDRITTNNNNNSKYNAINPLENSMIELDGDKVIGEEQMSTMKVAAENGKYYAQRSFPCAYYTFTVIFSQSNQSSTHTKAYACVVFSNRAMSRPLFTIRQ